MSGQRRFPIETLALLGLGVAFAGVGVFICVSAYRAGEAAPPTAAIVAAVSPALPQARIVDDDSAPAEPSVFARAPAPTSIFGPPPNMDLDVAPAQRPAPERSPPPALAPSSAFTARLTSPSIALGSSLPLPPTRPIELNLAAPKPTPSPSGTPGAPSPHADVASLEPMPGALSEYDHVTAVYDLTAHMVYLPNGDRLEAHSGLGALRDDPGHVDIADKGATPPHVYDLTLRESMFHGVQALRLNPVGGAASIFGRAGLLAHTYMLGPDGDSNGCVSFKDYDAFLRAFQGGVIKKLAVVRSLHSIMVAQRP